MRRFIDQIKKIEITTTPDIENVKPQPQIKVLGYLFNGREKIGNFDANIVSKLKSSF